MIVFVVGAERVEHEVHPETNRSFALRFAPRHDRLTPCAELVALKRAAEVVARVHDGDAITIRDAFEKRRALDASDWLTQKIERTVDGVLR